jgi:hypothetical protein
MRQRKAAQKQSAMIKGKDGDFSSSHFFLLLVRLLPQLQSWNGCTNSIAMQRRRLSGKPEKEKKLENDPFCCLLDGRAGRKRAQICKFDRDRARTREREREREKEGSCSCCGNCLCTIKRVGFMKLCFFLAIFVVFLLARPFQP